MIIWLADVWFLAGPCVIHGLRESEHNGAHVLYLTVWVQVGRCSALHTLHTWIVHIDEMEESSVTCPRTLHLHASRGPPPQILHILPHS